MSYFAKLARTLSLMIVFGLAACSNFNSHAESRGMASHAVADARKTGLISPESLLKEYSKFSREYKAHNPDSGDLKNFKRLDGFDMIVFFGTWCHDSQREVPRLLKLIDLSGVALNSLKLVAVNQDKQLPKEYASQYELKYTPTFYVTKNQQILATLVERPKQSITKELLSQILF